MILKPHIIAAATVSVVAADVVGFTAQYPAVVVAFSATFGVACGTIFWQLSQKIPTRSIGVIVGYLFICNWIAYSTHQLTADQVRELIDIDYIAGLWDLPPSTRYSFLSFLITQLTTGWQRLIHLRRVLSHGSGRG